MAGETYPILLFNFFNLFRSEISPRNAKEISRSKYQKYVGNLPQNNEA